jgi:hypothetical protein
VMRGLVKNIGGMRMPDEPFFLRVHLCPSVSNKFFIAVARPVLFSAPGPEARRNDWFKTSAPYSNM